MRHCTWCGHPREGHGPAGCDEAFCPCVRRYDSSASEQVEEQDEVNVAGIGAMLEQVEALWRDTLCQSAVRVYGQARRQALLEHAGAGATGEDKSHDVGVEVMVAYLGWMVRAIERAQVRQGG